MSSASSYRRSSRSSWSSGYDSNALGLGGSSSSSNYGSGSSYGYGRSSGIGSSGIGSSSSSSSRYGSGLDSLSSSRDYRSSSRSYRSSVDSPSSSSYSTRGSSYLGSSSGIRQSSDILSSRSGYIPSTPSTSSSYANDRSDRRRTSLTDSSKTSSDGCSNARKSSIDGGGGGDKETENLKSRVSNSKDSTSTETNVRNESSRESRRLDLRRRRGERPDSETVSVIESKRTSLRSNDSSRETNQDTKGISNDVGGDKEKEEKDRSRERPSRLARYDPLSYRRRYSRDADTSSEDLQKKNECFDRRRTSDVKDRDVQQQTLKSSHESKSSSVDVVGNAENHMQNGISDDVFVEEAVESKMTPLLSNAPSLSWRSSTSSSSHFGMGEGESLAFNDTSDTKRSERNLKREELSDIFPDANQKSKLVNGSAKTIAASTTSATTTANSNKRNSTIGSSSSSGNASQSKTAKEVVRLESLCEARTKELTHTKMQLKATGQAFDAMSVLLNYCCTELDAFQCPQLAQKLETVQKQLTGCLAEIGDLTVQKDTLTENLSQATKDKEEEKVRKEEAVASAQSEKEEYQRVQKEMDSTHNAALTTQRDELTTKHEDQTKRLKVRQTEEMKELQESFERKISAMKNENRLEISTLRLGHLEQIEALRAKHDSQMEGSSNDVSSASRDGGAVENQTKAKGHGIFKEIRATMKELHKQHRNKLEDITHRFESIKVTLSDKVESLRGECDDLRVRARTSEEALQKDADVKVQMALAPYVSLPKEIESLRTVLEMRNDEVQKLRLRNMDLEKHLEEIPIAREKIISLHQKVENLEAIINMKTDHEKQMHEKCQVLMRKYDRESRANKRLSMDYEQVMWRMSQSEYGSTESLTKRQLSRSPPRSETTSPDSRRKHRSPNPNSDVTLRVKKRSSNSESDGERKIRSRSATFVLEKDEDKAQHHESSPNSTQSTPRHHKKRLESTGHRSRAGYTDENDDPRMCRSAGAEMITAAIEGSRQAWTIDMTDSQSSLLNDEGMDSLPMGSTGGMAASYARSISGVSDSGVYDSMTRSDMLNSSIISTDSEWMASTHASMTLDSTAEEDFDSFSKYGHKVTSSDTVLDMSKFQGTGGSHDDRSESSSSAAAYADVTVIDGKDHHPQDVNSCDSQLNLTGGSEDDVFSEKALDLGDAKSGHDFTRRTNLDGSSVNARDVDVSISHTDSAISSNQQAKPS